MSDRDSLDRLDLLRNAEESWIKALTSAMALADHPARKLLLEHDDPYRLAACIAYVPLIRGIILGDVTNNIREGVFVDVLSITQAAGVQRALAAEAGDSEAVGNFLGFEYECVAQLSLLRADNPRYLVLPSSARAGSGIDYPDDTHDMVVVNQNWGSVARTIPVEVKSRPSRSELERYKALLFRGKMHLCKQVGGIHDPESTYGAFAREYEGAPTEDDIAIITHVDQSVASLLRSYQMGHKAVTWNSPTSYHDKKHMGSTHPEIVAKTYR